MRISNDIDKYLNYYFESLHYMGKLDISHLKQLSENKGQGAEYISCSFDPEDEDYKECKVTLYFCKPAIDEDTMVFVDKFIFYEGLKKICEKHILKFPEDYQLVQEYLKKIESNLL